MVERGWCERVRPHHDREPPMSTTPEHSEARLLVPRRGCRAYRRRAGRLLWVHARNAHSNGPYRNRRIHQ